MIKCIIAIALIPVMLRAQGNEIPYNSKRNSLTLTVENAAAISARSVTVEIQTPPDWLKLESLMCALNDIPPNQSKDAEFQFSVEKTAPVGKEEKLQAVIKTSDGQVWTKEISIKIGAPKEYRLYDNFPNPFNPSTKIAFELPITTKVKVIIYDALGRAIKNLTNEEHPAGNVELVWDGRTDNGIAVSSGVYFFRASTVNWHSAKKMIVMR